MSCGIRVILGRRPPRSPGRIPPELLLRSPRPGGRWPPARPEGGTGTRHDLRTPSADHLGDYRCLRPRPRGHLAPARRHLAAPARQPPRARPAAALLPGAARLHPPGARRLGTDRVDRLPAEWPLAARVAGARPAG